MVARVEVRPDELFTARFPNELCARIYTKDQRVLVKEHIGYDGGTDNPMEPRPREVSLVERSFRR
jgi:2-methylcitrate dehydratase